MRENARGRQDGPADKRGLARDMRYQRLLTAVRLRNPEALPALTQVAPRALGLFP
jgi:hypothetical protein